MHTKNVILVTGMVASMANPAQANIGNAGKLLFDFFRDGIADLLDEIFGGFDAAHAVPHHAAPRSGMKTVTRRDPPPGVPQEEYDRCFTDITGVTVRASSPGGGQIQFAGVPPSCMNLANVLIGDPASGPYALPCGSDCLSYSDLTEDQFAELANAINAVAS